MVPERICSASGPAMAAPGPRERSIHPAQVTKPVVPEHLASKAAGMLDEVAGARIGTIVD